MASLLHPEWVSYMFTYSGSNEALRGFMDGESPRSSATHLKQL